jgi:hypothetical protein
MTPRMGSLRSALIACLVFAGACGPIEYIKTVPYGAADKVAHARELGAEQFSPYWWTRATTYLRMAREVAAHADYQGANRFGRLAAEAADKAAEEAESGNSTSLKKRRELAPAKEDE